MRISFSVTALANFFRRCFPKRNIIIVSDRKVKHLPIGGKVQFLALALLVGGICWVSYSTGSYLAARSVIKEQRQALRSVTRTRLASAPAFPTPFQTSVVEKDDTESRPAITSLSEPMYSLSAIDHNKLFARIAFLEHQVIELKVANAAIIQRINDKALGRIDDIKALIRHTGLPVEELKHALDDKQAKGAPSANEKFEGGPYIPANTTTLSPQESTMYDNLDTLAVLRQIVTTLPLGIPIADATQESPFGRRIDPFTGHLAFHPGLDLAGPVGSQIYSTADGTVTFAGLNGGYGNMIDIDHGFGIVTRYGHLSKVLVKAGQVVHKGDVIGIEGSTGRSTGPHLHYEVRYHDQPINPINFLDADRYVSQN